MRASQLLFQRKPLKNAININYKTISSNIDEEKEFKPLDLNFKKDYSHNKNTPTKTNKFVKNRSKNMNKYSNHSFYNSSYGNINERKNHKIFLIQNSKKENKLLNLYNNNFTNINNANIKTKTKSFKNTSRKIVIYRSLNKNIKIDKNNINKIARINKDNKLILSAEHKERDNNILKTSYNQIKGNKLFYNNYYNNYETINIPNSNNNINIKNIYYYNYNNINTRNNSEVKNNDFEIKNISFSENNKVKEKEKNKKFSFANGTCFKKIKKDYTDGKYEGFIINNKRELKGVMCYKNGSKYEGQWKNDKRHGKGIFTSQNYNNPNLIGIKYEGEFNNDKIEGYGIGKYTSGDRYEGEWKNNKQYGRGILIYKEGGKYVGEWKNGKLNGNGIYYLKNGERYEGNFVDDKYNGYGEYYYNDGEYLEGIFKNDLPTGTCILHKIDGTKEKRDFD